MTKEITQNERLDLTDIREETEAYHRKFLDYCEVFELDPEKVMQEYFHDIAINSDEYKKLDAENQRLKAQLDREIKINRKMKETLKKYAECEPLEIKREYFNNEPTQLNKTMADIGALAREVLKEIENKE